MKHPGYFHGTSTKVLPLIAKEGLLPRDELAAKSRPVCYPYHSKNGAVYLVDDEANLETWKTQAHRTHGGRRATLCVRLLSRVRLQVDRNLEEYEEFHAWEHKGRIPPILISVHRRSGKCIPLRVWRQKKEAK